MKQQIFPILLLGGFALGLASCAVKPQSSFTMPTKKIVAPTVINFTNTSQNAETYEWDFGDGATATDANPSHRYVHSGNYTVLLKAKKGNKITTTKQMIQVTAPERCLIEIETAYGTIIAELYAATPKHRDNFVKLAEEGFFNDLLFHRVMSGFMIQGGDPQSRGAAAGQPLGTGGPGYQVPAEFVDSLVHVKGALASARTPDSVNPAKASSGSQFYIVQGGPVNDTWLNQIEAARQFHYTPEQRAAYLEKGGTPQLDREYTVFGQVIEGLDVIDKIAAVEVDARNRPKEDVKMKIIVIK